MTFYRYFVAAGLVSATAVYAQSPTSNNLTVEQSAIIYDQCLARQAVRANRTTAADTEIYGIAKAACAETRSMLVRGKEGNEQLLAVLNAIDADKEATFPELTRKIREQRAAREKQVQSGQN